MSYGELWKSSKLAFPLNVVMKLLRIRSPLLVAGPLSTSLQRLDWDELPQRGHDRLRRIVGTLESRGFSEVLVFREDWRARKLDCFSVALLDDSRTTLLLAMYTCFYGVGMNEGMRIAEHVDAGFYSFGDDGTVLATRSSQYPLLQPPEYDVVYVGVRPIEAVAALHEERVAARTKRQPYREAETWSTVERADVPARALALSRREAQFQIERGVYVPATAAELAMLEPKALRCASAKLGKGS